MPENDDLLLALKADCDAAQATLRYVERNRNEVWEQAPGLVRKNFAEAREHLLRHRGLLRD